ncbi:MAG TPA: TRAP transporter permease [bacterium]|nr:TRAP transporter permease [bacterium]
MRQPDRFWRVVLLTLTVGGMGLSLYQVFNLQVYTGVVILSNRFLYLLIGLFLSQVFVLFPAGATARRDGVPWYDVAMFLVTLGVCAYFAWHALHAVEQAWEFLAPTQAMWLSYVLWALILEGVRRTGGWVIFVLIVVLSLYPTYADKMPGPFAGLGESLADTARYHVLSTESVLGIPMQVFGSLIIGFIVFGVALQATGGGRFFINTAFALLGHVRGGPAKVAILASGLFGSLSGSVITNVLTTGAMTIPAMRRTGYPARYAAGIEACASTGGVLMPPIMGATAFVMASFLNIPYVTVAIAAVIPAFLYYLGLFFQIDAYAAREGIAGMPREELPRLGQTLKEGWQYLFAFGLLIWLLVYLRREALAPYYATAALLVLTQFRKDTRFDRRKVLEFIESNGHLLSELIAILAAVGLIIGGLVVTGMVGTFSGSLVRLAGGNPLLLLLMGAVTSFILGMGMTVTAAYIFLAIVLAPGLVKLGMDPLAVHLFIMYWGMLSYITPPVALGVFAAASLARANPMRTGLEAMRLGSIIYFLPFFFVLNPAMIFHGPWLQVLSVTGTAIVGVLLIAASMQGYLLGIGTLGPTPAGWIARALLLAGGLLLAEPGWQTNLAGVVLALPAVAIGRRLNRDPAPLPRRAEQAP